MSTITCKACGHSFETEATTNTRCRSCKTVVRVPAAARSSNGTGRRDARRSSAPPWLLVLLLACGHVNGYFDEDVLLSEAIDYLWTCEECGATEQEAKVLGSQTEAESDTMTDDEQLQWFDSILPAGAR